MAIVTTGLARVSNSLRTLVTTQSLASTQAQMLNVQNQISTGQRISTPSEDPGAASIIMQLQKTLENRQAYLSNIQSASSQLSEVDSTLGSITNLVQQAQSIASANVGSDVTQDQRNGAAEVVQSIYSQLLTLGNHQFNGKYLFGGDKANTPPFVEANGGVQFVGTNDQLENAFDESTVAPFTVKASDVFGAVTGTFSGTATLTPTLTLNTRVSDLGGATGQGVNLGAIAISDGTTSKTVDLSGADTIGDVIARINAAGVGGITAGINPAGTGLELTATASDNITVSETGSGTAAADLGILRTTGAGAGVSLVGTSVQPKLTQFSQLAGLNSGAGIDQASGIIITNGSKSATLSFAGCTTVQDVLNKINTSGTGVQAEINATGTGIDVVNQSEGTALTIGENGGSTAAGLGIRTYSPGTPLVELNSAKGVGTTASGADLRITRSDGVNIDVELSGAKTVGDVLAAINAAATAAGGGLTASFATTGNGIVLTDTAGGAGSVSASDLNGSTAAEDLGLNKAAVGNVLTGSDVNPIEAQGLFADVSKLRDALQKGDQASITAAGTALQDDYNRVVQTRGMNGATMQDLTSRQSRLQDQNTATKTALSQLQDTDFTTAITQFQTLQTALQASLQAAGKTMNLSLLDFLS